MRTGNIAGFAVGIGLVFEVIAASPVDIFSRVGGSIAVLEVLNEQGVSLGSHSAIVVEPEVLVTVCNVLEPAATLAISSKEQRLPATIVARDRDRNLCLVKAVGLTVPPISLRKMPLAPGARVYAISNALALGVGISEGVVSGLRPFPVGTHVQFTAPISPGSEGGALVDEDGQLIGVIDYRRRDGQNVNFASMAEWIGEVTSRSASNQGRLKRFDDAMALARSEQWVTLKTMADAWITEEPNAQDAWRFLVLAARGLHDADGELSGWQTLYHVSSDSAQVGVALGWALLRQGKAKEALDLAMQLTARKTEDASCWLLLGKAYHVLGQMSEAKAAYQRAAALDPSAIDAYQGLASLAQALGDNRSAIDIWRRLSSLRPNDLGLKLGLVSSYLTAGKATHAWRALSRLSGQDAESAHAWYLKATTLAQLGCPQQAIDAYHMSLERKLERGDQAWAGIGYSHHQLGRYPEAISAFEEALKLNPNSEEWRYELAVQLKDGGRAADALKITADLVASKPDVARNWRQQGFVLNVLGRTQEAIPAMERSLQLDAKQPKLWAALIESQQKLERRDEARKAYESLRALDSRWAETSYRMSMLPFEEGN